MNDSEQALNRQTLADQIAQRILNRAVASGVRPGDALPGETVLAAQFAVSRSAIREALKWLSGRGYIQIMNGRSARVQALDDGNLRAYFSHALHVEGVPFAELMEARKSIEIQSATLAAQRRTQSQVNELFEVIIQMRAELDKHHSDAYVDLDVDLHMQIARAAHNVVVQHLISAIRGTLNVAVHESLYRRRTRVQLMRVHELHEAIVSEIRLGNADGAGRAMQIHFDEALAFLYRDRPHRALPA